MKAERHPIEHEELLAALLENAQEPWQAFRRSDLAACEVCACEVEDQVAVLRDLDALATERHETERLAREVPHEGFLPALAWPPAGASAEARSTTPLARRPRERTRHPSWLALGAIAACVAATLLVVRSAWDRDLGSSVPQDSGLTPGLSLGAAGLTLAPAPGKQGELSWSGELPAGGWYRVHLYDAAGALLYEGPPQTTTRWSASSEQRATLRAARRWEVNVFDAAGTWRDASSRTFVEVP